MTPGEQLGPYRILAQLGAGGMGEVFRGRDSRLSRDVAIKVLPDALADSPDRLERFEREARAVGMLNHPNILTVYDVGTDGGKPYLVTELLEGATLRERLNSGAIPHAKAIGYARQIAEGLAAAHGKGITHRDLKPENLFLATDGRVRILDFGLAKFADIHAVETLTGVGVVMGTVDYMSPEQASGYEVDHRSDIFSFGSVLHEMLSGQRPFHRATIPETMAAIVRDEAPSLPEASPPLRRVVAHCLEKEPAARFQSASDLAFALASLDEVETTRSLPVAALTNTRATLSRARLFPWAVAAVLAVALPVAYWVAGRAGKTAENPLVRLRVNLGPESAPGRNLGAAISPDGTRMTYTAAAPDGKRLLAVRSLDQAQATLLAGTDNANDPFFSPDGKWIGFSAGGLKKISVDGGPAVGICDSEAVLGASWGEDQNIVFAPGPTTPLMRVSAAGGKPEPLTKVGASGDATHRWPQVLPGGRAVLFTSHKIVVGFDDARIEAVVVATGERKVLVRGGYFGRYLEKGGKGYLLYVHEGTLVGVAFDAARLAVQGPAVPLLDDVAGNADTASGEFDSSSSGTLLYRSGKGPSRTWPIVWADSAGKTAPLLAEPGTYYTPRISPDGKRLAVMADRGQKGREILVYDSERAAATRLTFTADRDEITLFPVWSPDGRYIVFETSTPKGYGIGVVRSDGSGKEQLLREQPGLCIPYSFSPDGKRLAFHELDPGAVGYRAYTATFDAADPDRPKLGPPEPFLNGQIGIWNAAFSPEGRWLAYTSNESGSTEIYVRAFRGTGSKFQISNGGGNWATWSSDGKSLFFSVNGRIMAVEYSVSGDTFSAGKPRLWSDVRYGANVFGREVTGIDGKRFAIIPRQETPEEPRGSVQLAFLMNFPDELRRKLPGK